MIPQSTGSGDPHELSDKEVLRRWVKEPDDDGAITLTVFRRYRRIVRTALEDAGLSTRQVVEMVPEVLHRARAHRPETTLRARLLGAAEDVADAAK